MLAEAMKEFVGLKLREEAVRRYHKRHEAEARQTLRVVTAGGAPLAPGDRRRCDAYAADALGSKAYAPWLYVYSAVAGGFREGWIPDNYYGQVVVPRLKGHYGDLSSLKPLNYAVFASDDFPDLLSYVNGLFLDKQSAFIAPEHVSARLFGQSERVVYKLDNSLRGTGIYFFDKTTFDLNTIRRLGNGLFQTFIEQHPLLSSFSNSSVATLRVTTACCDSGQISVRACYLRFGGDGDTHVKSASHIRVPIDLASGRFADAGYTPQWRVIDRHPGSNMAFSGTVFPHFAEVLSVVTALHRKVPYMRCIGWDATVDAQGRVRVMECNGGHNDIKFSEATQGPCFTDLHWERLSKS